MLQIDIHCPLPWILYCGVGLPFPYMIQTFWLPNHFVSSASWILQLIPLCHTDLAQVSLIKSDSSRCPFLLLCSPNVYNKLSLLPCLAIVMSFLFLFISFFNLLLTTKHNENGWPSRLFLMLRIMLLWHVVSLGIGTTCAHSLQSHFQ